MFMASEIHENCRLLDNSNVNVFCKVQSESPRFYIFSYDYPQRHIKHGREHQDVVPK